MTKTITFAIMHFTIAFGVVYAMTGSLLLGGAVALVEPAVNTVAFYFHERLWKRIEHRRSSRRRGNPLPVMQA
ncbi:MAG TPA: DUF2061 domain-containing protein [Pseudomonas xinjiangensis]|uniref:DUF2061 domain-containing protein n=2 Tax=root TaxID=1 RepID=A0A7V1FQM9_9GAMM|nr:DUF2061 domain-containing protein [Halopseudomonas xinjiangensis]HEC47805.1 DUF2061 domain-containing protein [Halopseudomonas xinjiangensis]